MATAYENVLNSVDPSLQGAARLQATQDAIDNYLSTLSPSQQSNFYTLSRFGTAYALNFVSENPNPSANAYAAAAQGRFASTLSASGTGSS